jgi:hypothetical protein
MAKVIYKEGNYVVVTDANNVDRVFPIGKTVYEETAGNFLISEGQVEREQLIIPVSDTVNWVDNDGTNYTEATFRDFLRTNTGFNPASGGSGATWGGITGTLSTQTDLQSELDDKQDTLVSATNIKTINGTSVLGSGDLAVGGSGGASGFHVQLLPGGSLYGGIMTQSNVWTGGSNYANQTSANQIFYFPFIPSQDFTSSTMRFNVNAAGAGDEARLCIYSHDGFNAPQNKLYESSNIDLSTTGYKTITETRNWTKGEVYWLAIHMKSGSARIMGSGGNKPDTLVIGLLNSNRIKTWVQMSQTFANGAPATASPNTYRYDTFIVEFN